MKSTKIWIADSEVSYAEAFQEYVNLKKSHLFQVRTCTEKEKLEKAFAQKEIEILLITAEWYQICKDWIRQECVIFLSEGSLPAELSMYSAVYKYQSVENILREILYFYTERDIEEEYVTGVQRENSVIGVFSPVTIVEKNKFALALGQILAEEQNVLYLNLEECSGLSGLLGGNHWSLADLIYYLRESKKPFLYRLNSIVQKLDRMDYIPPCESYIDFRQITVEEWRKLIHLIRTQGMYDTVVLDLGMMTGHELEVLRQCDGIYVPVCRNIISQAKISQWERHLQILDGMDVLEKLQKLELPVSDEELGSEEGLFMLPQQEIGRFVRNLLRE